MVDLEVRRQLIIDSVLRMKAGTLRKKTTMEKLVLESAELTKAAEVSAAVEQQEAAAQKHINPFSTKEAYLAMKKAWAAKKEHTAWEHVFYNLLRGMKPEKGFTLPTNKNKVNNGALKWTAFMEASRDLNRLKAALKEPKRKFWNGTGEEIYKPMLAIFGATVTPEIAAEVLSKI